MYVPSRKRKPDWVLNPRKTDWTENQNKFGLRMLEKMGWSKGKGLGVSEQGMTEAIRIRYKNDTKAEKRLRQERKQRGKAEQEIYPGFGHDNKSEEWSQQQDNFNRLLQTLNENLEPDEPTSVDTCASLEEKSKNSKKRVHYHKFTRNKDVAKYSEKDLKCIVGNVKEKLEENQRTLNDYSQNMIGKHTLLTNGRELKPELNATFEVADNTDDDIALVQKINRKKKV